MNVPTAVNGSPGHKFDQNSGSKDVDVVKLGRMDKAESVTLVCDTHSKHKDRGTKNSGQIDKAESVISLACDTHTKDKDVRDTHTKDKDVRDTHKKDKHATTDLGQDDVDDFIFSDPYDYSRNAADVAKERAIECYKMALTVLDEERYVCVYVCVYAS
jgi:hypothetical protein